MLIFTNITIHHILKRTLFLALLFSSFFAFSQNIKVQNSETKQGVSEVFVYNKDKSITSVSDSSGLINLSSFSKRDTLIFTHQSYATFMIPKLNVGNVIYLEEQIITIPSIEIVAEQEKSKALEVVSKIDQIEPFSHQFDRSLTLLLKLYFFLVQQLFLPLK